MSQAGADGVTRRLKELRESHRWTIQQLADESGLSYFQVYRIETGQRKRLSAGELYALAEALGVTSTELLAGKESPPQSPQLAVAARIASSQLAPELESLLQRAGKLFELSAQSAADVPTLVAAVEAVLELHQRNRYDECIECLSTDEYGEATNVDYPCPTVTAIHSALGEGEK